VLVTKRVYSDYWKCVRCGGKIGMHTGIWWLNLLESDDFADLGVGRRIILKSIEKSCTGFILSVTGTTLRCSE